MDCRGKVYAITLTQSTAIHLPKGCDIYKYTDKLDYTGGKITQVDITSHSIQQELHLNDTDVYKRLSLLPMHDKYNLQFIETMGKAKRFAEQIPLQREKISNIGDLSNISLWPNLGFFDFLSSKITQFVIIAVIALVGLFFSKALLIKIITDWKK